MIGGGLTLALAFGVLGMLPSMEHVLIGVSSVSEFVVRVDGVEFSPGLIRSDELGILTFATPELSDVSVATVSIAVVEPGPSLVCGEAER